ncbi:hypothetical protein ACC735_38965, partial [Rhizobium ruizarguesonis]
VTHNFDCPTATCSRKVEVSCFCKVGMSLSPHLPSWTHMYNWHLPHGSLKSKTLQLCGYKWGSDNQSYG